jgi:hypothetical protein
MRSYERAAGAQELFPFRWVSSFFGGREMYFKFCLSGDAGSKKVFVFSIHEHREQT